MWDDSIRSSGRNALNTADINIFENPEGQTMKKFLCNVMYNIFNTKTQSLTQWSSGDRVCIHLGNY